MTIKLNDFGGGGGAEIGDIIASPRTALDDGRVLLPLKERARILTSAEEASYPLLSSKLASIPAFTQVGTNSTITMTDTFNAGQYATDAVASVVYHDNGVAFNRYDRSTDTISTLFSGGSSDQIVAMACSADGTIVAFIQWDQSGVQFVLRISINSGASFAVSFTGTTGANASDKGSVHISPDGSMVCATISTGAAGFQYVRVDDPTGSVVPDVSTNITANLSGSNINPQSKTSFSDDGITFVMSYPTLDGTDEYITDYTEDSGATFTRINAHPLDIVFPVAAEGEWQVVLDAANPQRLLFSNGQISEAGNMFYSNDKGLNWSYIPAPNLAKFTGGDVPIYNGWFQTNGYRMQFRGDIALLRVAVGFFVMCYIDPTSKELTLLDTAAEKCGTQTSQRMCATWAADGLSIGVAGSLGVNEYPFTSGIMTYGKFLPSVETLSNSKIVADAP